MKTRPLGTGTPTNRELLLDAYAAYNRRDSDALLALVSEEVEWPDGSARLHGRAELRAYWTRQGAVTRTHDEPVEVTDLSPEKSVVRINQVVRALDGTTISEGSFDHVYQIEGGLIVRMDILNVEPVDRVSFPSMGSRTRTIIPQSNKTLSEITEHSLQPSTR